jgi:hypothetical protein
MGLAQGVDCHAANPLLVASPARTTVWVLTGRAIVVCRTIAAPSLGSAAGGAWPVGEMASTLVSGVALDETASA